MDFFAILIALVCLGGLTFALSSVLIMAFRKLHVAEDPRIDVVESLLPHANCGACGFPGCRPFAEALVKNETQPATCSVSPPSGHAAIAAYLGVSVGVSEKRVARLACAGGSNVARNRARYTGHPSCRAAALVAGGPKGCSWGCIGLGDCVAVCDFDALDLNEHDLPVVNEANCTACGDCVEICPKDLFSIHPVSHRLWVACRSLEHGDRVLEHCEVGCNGCSKCAIDAPAQLTMQHNLPVIDYARRPAPRAAIDRCPTGAIVWFDEHAGIVTGLAAQKPHRHDVRPAEFT
ncbi:MAG: electron transport complex protein RnfB [Kiritimatiellia bacterium]|jgi:electron transport complex protein RnfB